LVGIFNIPAHISLICLKPWYGSYIFSFDIFHHPQEL
jgi:hypothetical protein